MTYEELRHLERLLEKFRTLGDRKVTSQGRIEEALRTLQPSLRAAKGHCLKQMRADPDQCVFEVVLS